MSTSNKIDTGLKRRDQLSGKTSSTKLKNKEAEYRKVNAKLEVKTASLVKEVEHLIQGHSLVQHEKEEDKSLLNNDPTVPNNDRQTVNVEREDFSKQEITSTVAISTDIERTVRQLEEKLEKEEFQCDIEQKEGNIIPLVAEELGNEAMLRFLKAKLRVMQEEMEKLTKNYQELEKKYQSSIDEVKTLTEHNKRLEKTQQSLKSSTIKYQELIKELQDKTEALEIQLVAMRREVDSEKTLQKKLTVTHSGTEVRLNRALEDVEKYKNLYQKLKLDSKDSVKYDRHKLETLEVRNKTLEKHKKELLAAFGKQLRLIDILKRQKIHLEAARMIAFAEEEFVKVLDWDVV